ncbi:MAG: arginine--tRNA ligase, partial [Desulfurobacteriaceae bacterium]
MKEFVRERVEAVLRELYEEAVSQSVERASFEKPKRKEFGDLATNVAFLLARDLGKSPKQIAEELANKLRSFKEFEKVEVAGGGFINFTFSQELYTQLLREVVETDFFISNIGKGERVLLEYVSANPTGPLHVGHGRGAVVGDVLHRIMKLTGYKPEREFYINDAGRQIKLLGLSIFLKAVEASGGNPKETLKELISSGVIGSDAVDEKEECRDCYKGEYIKELAVKLLSKRRDILSVPPKNAIEICAEFGKEELLKEIESDLKELRVEFDNWFSEKSLYESGKVEKVLEILKEKGFLYEKEGALWLKTTLFGDDKDRVVRRSNGEYTYFASDIAYHYDKIERGYDRGIDIWGADHHGYIQRVKAAIQ